MAEGVRLHAALGRAGRPDLAQDFDWRVQALLRTASSYAGAYQVDDLEALPDLYARVVDHVRGLTTWVEETDSWLCPMPPAGQGLAAAAGRRPAPRAKRLSVNPATLEVRYRRRRLRLVDGKPFKLLCYLAEQPQHRRSYAEVERAMYGSTGHVADHTIDAHASRLRRALRNTGPAADVWHDLAGRIRCRELRWFIDL